MARVVMLDPPLCRVCGNQVNTNGKCNQCRAHPPNYAAVRSWGVYEGPLRQAIRKLKYRRDIPLGEALARHLIAQWKSLEWKVDLVTPVPLSAARLAERGYNQAALLALPLALSCGLTYSTRILKKIRNTPSQVGLDFMERQQNVKNTFVAAAELVQDKIVLIVDDVVTSGATMDACSQALRAAGAQRVYGLSLARAVKIMV